MKFQQPTLPSCVEASALRTPVCVEKDLWIPGLPQPGCEFITSPFPEAGAAQYLLLADVYFPSDGQHK